MSHPVLTDLDDTDVQREIADSKTELAAKLDREVHPFCYPAGIFTERERRLVAESRYRYARYYRDESLTDFCVPSRDPNALARGVLELASNYADYRRRFAENGRSLADFHSGGNNSLIQLVDPLSVQPDETAHASSQ